MAESKTASNTAQATKLIAVASDAAVKKLAVATEKASKKLIKDAEEVATHLRSSAAIVTEAATKLLAVQAEAAVKVVNAKGGEGGDHDSIIRIITLLEVAQKDITEIKDKTSLKLESHETRIQLLEKSKGAQSTVLTIGIVIITTIFGMLVYHLFGINL